MNSAAHTQLNLKISFAKKLGLLRGWDEFKLETSSWQTASVLLLLYNYKVDSKLP